MALKSLDDARVRTNKRRWSDGLQQYKWVEGWQKLRLFGDIYTDAVHTIKTKTGKFYPEYCHAYDWQNDKFADDRGAHCEACRLKIPARVRHYANAISLDKFENMPRNPPADWTCIFMVDLAPSLVESLYNLKPLNENFAVSDTARGALLNIKFDPKSPTPANMYYAAVKTPNFQIDPEIVKLTLTQEMPDGKRIIRRGTDTVPPQWVYVRGTESSAQDMKESLRRNGFYEEASETNAEVAKTAGGMLTELLDVGEPSPPKTSNVKQLAILREDPTPDEAPPPKPVKVASVANAAPEAPADDFDIPF